MLIGHTRNAFFVPFKSVNNPTLFEYIFYGLTNLQNEAVLFFFVISGYLIGGKLLEYCQNDHIPIARYCVDRLVRLYIVLIPCLGLTAISQLSGYCGHDDTLETYVGNLFYVQHVLAPKLVCNEPLWSLANEFWYYTIGLFVAVYVLRSKTVAAVGLLLCLVLLLFDDFNRENILVYFWAWGAGVALTWSAALRRFTPGIFLASGLLVTVLIYSRISIVGDLFRISDLFVVIAIFLFLSAARNLDAPNIAPRFGRFMASFSFSLYVIHWPLLRVISGVFSAVNFHPGELRATIVYLGSCLFTLIAAYVFSLATERNTHSVRIAANNLFFNRR